MANGAEYSTTDSASSGLYAHNDATTPPPPNTAGGSGVLGITISPGAAGVFGANNTNQPQGVGVQGNGPEAGVSGFSPQGVGVRGYSIAVDQSAIFGINFGPGTVPDGLNRPAGAGVWGHTRVAKGAGVVGSVEPGLQQGVGVQGDGPEAGVSGWSPQGVGVRGFCNAAGQSAIFGMNSGSGTVPDGLNRPAGGGVWGHTKVEKGSGVIGSVEPGLQQAAGVTGIGPTAGLFFGNVVVNGDIRLSGADFAETFDSAEASLAVPGTVMVLDDSGGVVPSKAAYDKRAAGVVSGAGEFKAGIIMGVDGQDADSGTIQLALAGRVFCKVDADIAPIEVGDLLTTSSTAGHAMKAADPARAFGAVIGKALRPQHSGQGLIPILIALQ